MIALRGALTVLVKDLKIELRTLEVTLATALFALLTVVLAAFAFGLDRAPGKAAAPGVLWIAIAFGGILALNRTFLRERDLGVFTAVLLSPLPRSALFLGKTLGVLVFLLAVELVLIPIIELFFHAPLLANLPALAPILLLGTLGYAAAGTLFAAMTVRTRLKDLLLGVVLFPLVAPALIASIKAMDAVLAGDGLAGAADYLRLLGAFDLLFVVGGLWLFGALFED
jgi:heme exporter protein B